MDTGSLDALLGASDQPLVLFDRVGDMTYVNGAFRALSGHASGSIAPGEAPVLEPPILVARALDRTWTVPSGRVWLRCADGQRRQVWVDVLPMQVAGEMLHLCTVRPTAVEVSAPAVGLDDARLRELLANLPGGVYRCSYDRRWRTLFMSERFADICGCPSASFLEPYGRSFKDIVVEDDVPAIQAAVRRAIRSRAFYEVEFRIRRPDGEVRWLLDRGMPVADREGRVRWLDGAMFDITAQKDAEARAEALEVQRAAAEAASMAKSRFLAVMSHEMRTPLNAIVGMTALLADSELDDAQRAHVETARVSSGALLDLIDDVLDFSRLDAGDAELDPRDFDLVDCVGSAVAAMRPRAEDKGLRLDVRIAGAPRWLRGDPRRLRQVLSSLLSNAIKFTLAGEVRLTITHEAAIDAPVRLRIAVRDTGIGIAPERLDDIFDVFQQVDLSTTRRYEGAGLGLAISRRLVESMGGELRAESALGAGSTFWFEIELPRADAPADPDADSGGTIPPLKVLLAEDNPVNQRVTLRLLEALGLSADVAPDGARALAALEAGAYDLVLMDVRMPEVDGLEATRRLRAELSTDRQPRVVAVTANTAREDKAACFAAGMDAFLGKPLHVRDLRRTLLDLFRGPDPRPRPPESHR